MLFARLSDPPPPVLTSGTWLPAARPTPAFTLLNQQGQAVNATFFQGQPALVFFGFSNCPDVCPTTLALLATVRRQSLLKPLKIVMVTVDPERDQPRQLQRYLQAFDPDFAGLTGEPAELNKLTKAWSAAAARQDLPGGDYTMDHSATVYLLDNQGRLVTVFTPPLALDKMVQDLNSLRNRLD